MTLEDIVARGRAAEALLKNTLLNEAFEAILGRINREWLAIPRESTLDRDKREELHARANAIQELRGQLTGWMNDAIAEQAKQDRADKRAKGAK